jgi:hypothetical protein
MRNFKLVTILVLGLLIFGTASYFAYDLFIKPHRAEKREKAAEAATPKGTPLPDPGTKDLQRLKGLHEAGKIMEARNGLKAWLETHPQSPLLKEARKQLGSCNMILLFAPAENSSIITYTVVKGDSLAKIAGKHQSNAELIQRANNLPNINLQIGQQLVIPSLKPSLELDRQAKTLTLLDNGAYLKEYTLLSAPAAPKTPSNTASKVLDKVATAGTKRVAFGAQAYAQSDRIIILTGSPAIVGYSAPPPVTAPTEVPARNLNGTNAVASNTIITNALTMNVATNTPAVTAPTPPPAPMPGGYVLSTEDLLEIFPLVSRNTPVIIH